MKTHTFRRLPLAVLGAALALVAMPSFAQHEGHTMPVSTPASPPVTKVRREKPAAKPPAKATSERPTPAAVDHAAMGHTAAPEQSPPVDHAAMGHGVSPASTTSAPATVDHAAMGHGSDPDLPADAAPRTPIPALTDADRAAAFPSGLHGHSAHDQRVHSFWLVDRLEWQDTEEGSIGWEGLAWIGGDLDRLWLRTEGEAEDGEIESGNLEVLYGRSVSAWWDAVAGLRHDSGEGPSRTWAAFGVQGLAPYKFEIEATAYVGNSGRTAATVEVEYDTLITNRLILQWQGEANLYGKDDPALGIGSGLSTIEAGARLRYEFSRRFAPYIGVEFERAFGETADLRREDGEPVRDTRLVAGIRFWF